MLRTAPLTTHVAALAVACCLVSAGAFAQATAGSHAVNGAAAQGSTAPAAGGYASGTAHPNYAAPDIAAPGSIPDDATVKGLASTTAPTTAGSAAASPDDSIAGSTGTLPGAPGQTTTSASSGTKASKGSSETTLPPTASGPGSWSTTVDASQVKRAGKVPTTASSPTP